MNPIPPTGSIQISWPLQVEVTPELTCTVTTNRAYLDACTVDMSGETITIVNVFSSETSDFYSEVEIELKYVTNPLENRE